MKTKIIYEDQHILVCYKPAGLATQTARVGQQDMVSELKNYLAGKARQQAMQADAQKKPQSVPQKKFIQPYLGVIHRLDQPVEGLLVFAKNSPAAAKLTAQLSQGTLNKQYYAVVCGQPPVETAELVDYLVKDEASGSAVVVEGENRSAVNAKKAVLQYRVISQLSTQAQIAMLDIHIDTGRFHQIRAQMTHAGLPLLGDGRYGSELSCMISRELQVRNVALCAYKIVLKHPATGKQMTFEVKPEGSIFAKF